MKALFVLLLVCLTTFGFPKAASAHVLETDYSALAAKTQLQIQAKFNTGEPYPDAAIAVFTPLDQTKPWLESKADGQGRFVFAPDRSIVGDWTVKIGKSDHADILTIPVTQSGVDSTHISQGWFERMQPQITAMSVAVMVSVLAMQLLSWLAIGR